MSWQETNEEAGKCGSEELVNKLLWVTSNHDFHCCPTASGTWWQNWSSSQAWPKKDPWLSCSCSLPHEGCHMLSAPMCSPDTLFTSQVGFRLCSFYFCFSFRTFFLASSSSKGSFNMEIEGSKHSLQKSRGCVLAGVGFGKANPYVGSISQVLGLWHLMSPSSPLGFCLVLIHNPGLTFKALVLCT